MNSSTHHHPSSGASPPLPRQDGDVEPRKAGGSEPTTTAFQADWRLKAAFGSIMLITLMAAVDATALSVALPAIQKDIGGTSVEIFWVGTSFLLASTVFQPTTGSLSNLFGRRPLLFASLAFFGVGSVVAAVAPSVGVLLVGRSVQGVGGGGIITLSEIVITDLIPLRERGKWYSLQSSMWSLGTVLGPLAGGGFAQSALSWRAIFWLNVPFLAAGVPLIYVFLRIKAPPRGSGEVWRRVDWAGSALFVASATAVLVPVTWGGVQFAWDSWQTLVPLLVGAGGVALFLAHQALWLPRRAPDVEPTVRLELFTRGRSAAAVHAQNCLHGMILWCIMYYLPLYYEGVQEYGSTLAAVALFPMCLTVAPAAGAVGFAVARLGCVRWALWAGWALAVLGAGLLVLLRAGTSVAGFIFLTVVGGVGLGMLFTAMAIALQAASPPELQAHSMTMFTFLRNLGQTLGVAAGSSVFLNSVKSRLATLPDSGGAGALSGDAIALVHVIKEMAPGPAKEQLKGAFVASLQYTWALVCAFAVIGLVCSGLVGRLSLDQEMKTDQGFQRLESEKNKKQTGGDEEASSPFRPASPCRPGPDGAALGLELAWQHPRTSAPPSSTGATAGMGHGDGGDGSWLTTTPSPTTCTTPSSFQGGGVSPSAVAYHGFDASTPDGRHPHHHSWNHETVWRIPPGAAAASASAATAPSAITPGGGRTSMLRPPPRALGAGPSKPPGLSAMQPRTMV